MSVWALWLACGPEPDARTPVTPGAIPELCGNGDDDDLDGSADCFDSDCAVPACPEQCGDGRDNDGDALVDCADAQCFGPTCPEACLDGLDNDLDGLSGCADSDCNVPDCPEACDDGRDNDADGAADCHDAQCWCSEVCPCDLDGDGSRALDQGGTDCDDLDPNVHVDGEEVCNERDDDCDGAIDDDDFDTTLESMTWMHGDVDLDGFGDLDNLQPACEPAPGRVENADDCNDADPLVNPLALEACNGLDDDCDDLTDDDDDAVSMAGAIAWYPDDDLDGAGDGSAPQDHCDAPDDGWVLGPIDCDDTDPLVGASSDWWADGDGDGFGAGASLGIDACTAPPGSWVPVAPVPDCNDTDPAIHPSAPDLCDDEVDQDCDGAVDDCQCSTVVAARLPGYLTYATSAWEDAVLTEDDDACKLVVVDFDVQFDLATVEATGAEVILLDFPGYEQFTEQEKGAIEAWALSGRGGVVAYGALSYTLPAATDLAPLLGVSPDVTTDDAYVNTPLLDQILPNHPLLARVADPFDLSASTYGATSSLPWSDSVLPGAVVVAADPADDHAVIAYQAQAYRAAWVTPGLYSGATADSWKVLHNGAVWAAGYETE